MLQSNDYSILSERTSSISENEISGKLTAKIRNEANLSEFRCMEINRLEFSSGPSVRIRFSPCEMANGEWFKGEKARQFWTATPFLIVVTVLTPATTWTEGFTNRLIGSDYSENLLAWQMASGEKYLQICRLASRPVNHLNRVDGWQKKGHG